MGYTPVWRELVIILYESELGFWLSESELLYCMSEMGVDFAMISVGDCFFSKRGEPRRREKCHVGMD